jgi:hypothetical protein
LLSQVTATLVTTDLCPLNTVSCRFSKKLHTIIVLSQEPEIIYLLSLVAATQVTLPACPLRTAS